MPPDTQWPTAAASAPNDNFATTRGDGQLIEFIAGYTIPIGRPTFSGASADTITVPLREASGGPEYFYGQLGQEFRRRVGCVLTIIDKSSELHGMSTRIVGYVRQEIRDGSGNLNIIYHRYQILPFEGVDPQVAVYYFTTTTSTGNNFIINGTPFSGNGTGFNNAASGNARNTDAYSDSLPTILPTSLTNPNASAYPRQVALLPNHTDTQYDDISSSGRRSWCNEDYDAPDFQNMLLALEHHDGIAAVLTRSPSLHRPELANYWLQTLHSRFTSAVGDSALAWRILIQPYGPNGLRMPDDPDDDDPGDDTDAIITLRDIARFFKRRCLMRPLTGDHLNFDGSNSQWPNLTNVDLTGYSVAQLEWIAHQSWGAVDLLPGLTTPWLIDSNADGLPDALWDTNGDGNIDILDEPSRVVPWDVDNDGDGVPDSVWVDIGLPVRALPDGRKYRPLVAMHCIDLDGRVNLNTAGSAVQLQHVNFDHDVDNSTPAQLYPQHDLDVAENGFCPVSGNVGLVYARDLENNALNIEERRIDLARGQGCRHRRDQSLLHLQNDRRSRPAANRSCDKRKWCQ